MSIASDITESENFSGGSSTDEGYVSNGKASGIPSKFLNDFGFVDYDHYGEKPWTDLDEAAENVVLPPSYTSITRVLALDCEMVGIGNYKDSALARVSIVNENGYCVYDTFVLPNEEVTDYRTEFSGIRAEDLVDAPSTDLVLEEVSAIVNSKILIGQSIYNDLEVLKLNNHPKSLIRDTAVYFKKQLRMKGTPSLKDLVSKYLHIEIQKEEHSSIIDAQATLKLYQIHRDAWEKDFIHNREIASLTLDFNALTMKTPPDAISDMHVEPREPDLFVDSKSVFLRKNKVIGSYSSCGEYLDTQFRLLLEDFLRPLRDCVQQVDQWRQFKENSLFHNVQIRIGDSAQFEVKRSGTLLVPIERNNLRDVDWEESKIFMNGSLLLLTPDDFKSVKFAVIKYRPEEQTNPYSLVLHVEFSKHGPSWTVGKNNNKFLMMESAAFYEAYKHSLEYLQTVDLNKFPLKKYIVDAVTTPQPPKYLLSVTNKLDFSVSTKDGSSFKAAPLDFKSWPDADQLNLDDSQFEAFQKALTQEMTIIQGPPGTGKTFIGIEIVKLLLENPWLHDSPILIVSYTNHALDQTLEYILDFITNKMCGGNEKEANNMILRIGGGSKSEIIQPLVLTQKMLQYMEKRKYGNKLNFLRKILIPVKDFCFQNLLLDQGILDIEKLPKAILDQLSRNESTKEFFGKWKSWQSGMRKDPLTWFGLQQKDVCYSTGQFILYFNHGFDATCHYQSLTKVSIDSVDISNLDHQFQNNNADKSKIYKVRWTCYLFLVKSLKDIVEEIQQKIVNLEEDALEFEHSLSRNMSIRAAKVIGMTTTGAVKHKYIVHKTKPKIMIVEEAAHVLEAHVVASLTEHCQQMIMIGDHQQLRPMTADYKLATDYKLDVSLMERLVKNGVDQGNQNWTQLKVQHRMRPEIARMVCPVIYKELYNHPSVQRYPNVHGCSKNLFFVNHRHAEGKEVGSRSFCNMYEVNFMAGLVKYFVDGGYYEPHQITVIATYLAQKVLIENKLHVLKCSDVRISTVDGYQGEENDIILLSLVRNNTRNTVGFLKTDNRVCVALSRARHGLFMIGNMSCLKTESKTWSKINDVLVEMGCIGRYLPLTGTGFTVESIGKSNDVFVPNATRFYRPYFQDQQYAQQSYSNHLTFNNKRSGGYRSWGAHILSCGHQQNFAVGQSNNLNDFKCLEVVWKKLVCGHSQSVACYLKDDDENILCTKTRSKQLPCGHRQIVACYLPVSKVRCTKPLKKVLPCGHEQYDLCHDFKANVQCNISVSCGHQKVVPCHQSHRLKCHILVKKDLPCGHYVEAECSEDVSDWNCELTVQSTLRCGHFQSYPCHLRNQWKCSKSVIKRLPCGHHQKTACHLNPADVYCKSLMPSNCSHKMLANCYEVRNKTVICDQKCGELLKCGHRCPLPCHEGDMSKHADYQCTKICKRACPNGHSCSGTHQCNKFCPLSLKYSKCLSVVGCCSAHGDIVCYRTKKGDFSCDAQCDYLFKCGHQCRYLCHEDDNPEHMQYTCTERCQRTCPIGHPCSGDHDCYKYCSVKSGKCPKCTTRIYYSRRGR